jgi:DNA-binding MarR family transcriptional regulator
LLLSAIDNSLAGVIFLITINVERIIDVEERVTSVETMDTICKPQSAGGAMAGRLKEEIKQKRPFSSTEEEVVLSIMRTVDLVVAPLGEVLRTENLSTSQYNVLRILRGAAEPLPCGEISERMVRRDPDLTRLLDRMEKRGLIARERATADRRVVLTKVTPEGRALVDAIEPAVERALEKALAHVPKKRLELLLELLEEIRG